MRAKIGNIGEIDIKMLFTIGTSVYGKGELDFDGSLGFGVADVAESSFCGISS